MRRSALAAIGCTALPALVLILLLGCASLEQDPLFRSNTAEHFGEAVVQNRLDQIANPSAGEATEGDTEMTASTAAGVIETYHSEQKRSAEGDSTMILKTLEEGSGQ